MTRTYEAFASEPEYLDLNRRFLDTLPLAEVDTVLDVACGTGTLVSMIREMMAAGRSRADCRPFIAGVDISRESLELALRAADAIPGVGFVQATAENLPFPPGAFQLVTIGNAIQLFDDKEAVARDVRRVLRPGGTFAFNTSFYAGTFVPGTERFYLNWVQEAYRYVADRAQAPAGSGEAPRRRRRDASRPAFSQQWLSREQYADLLTGNGFVVQSVAERVVMLTERSFQAIGSYAGLSTVLLRGYPAEVASEALEKSAGHALATTGMKAIPRNWIEFIATRT